MEFLSGLELPVLETRFDFLSDSPLYKEEKPYYLSIQLLPSQESRRTNLIYQSAPAFVYDIRGAASCLSLQAHGIEYVHLPMDFAVSRNSNQTVTEYMRNHIDFLRQKLNAKLCICYSSRVCPWPPRAIRQVLIYWRKSIGQHNQSLAYHKRGKRKPQSQLTLHTLVC